MKTSPPLARPPSRDVARTAGLAGADPGPPPLPLLLPTLASPGLRLKLARRATADPTSLACWTRRRMLPPRPVALPSVRRRRMGCWSSATTNESGTEAGRTAAMAGTGSPFVVRRLAARARVRRGACEWDLEGECECECECEVMSSKAGSLSGRKEIRLEGVDGGRTQEERNAVGWRAVGGGRGRKRRVYNKRD